MKGAPTWRGLPTGPHPHTVSWCIISESDSRNLEFCEAGSCYYLGIQFKKNRLKNTYRQLDSKTIFIQKKIAFVQYVVHAFFFKLWKNNTVTRPNFPDDSHKLLF